MAGSRENAGWGWLAACVLTLFAIAIGGFSAGEPATSEEIGYLLAAESLARDGDLVLSVEDESRIRSRGWSAVARPVMRLVDGQVLRFRDPWFYPLLLAPFAVASPEIGPVVLNGLLLALAIAVGASSIRKSAGEAGAWTLVALVFGSVLALYLPMTLPVLFLVATTVCALALFASPAAGRTEATDGLYRPQELLLEGISRRTLISRSLAAGALVGVVAAHHILYTLLLLSALALSDRRLWRTVLPSAVVGALFAFALTWPLSGLWPDVAIVPSPDEQVQVIVGAGVTEIERAEEVDLGGGGLLPPSHHLLGWNALYAAVGSHVGVVPYFAPIALLLLVWRRSDGGGAVLALAALGLGGSILLFPFDFAGLPAAVGNSVFVPFYVLMWFLPIRPLGSRGGLLAVALGVVILWPLWVSGTSALVHLERGLTRGPVLDRLPYETTQRDLPVSGEVVTRDFLVRSLGGIRSGGRAGHFRLPGGGHADLLVATPGRLGELDLLFDSAASTQLMVEGGAVGNMILTPRGGVTFRVIPDESRIRHPVWWSSELHTFHRLRVSMPSAGGETTFSISSSG